ncbi:ADP-ribosylation factor-binding protein GGA3 [Orussus abietinus]|uniref:ADP-ribosylation factor-binding protein GGA3 n=1 Tax=Orussus abietinus TaxID=222816 RepID=UPI0006257D2A|nr:ADP-ribosylation factor-binding protein GGA3 [Orussus abietinus]
MDIVTTSLEALLQMATNPQNVKPDMAAIGAFCATLTREPQGMPFATKLIATRIQSNIEWEALQTLTVLDICMKRCGSTFHAEVGKFRFLNEMIKLVSPRYLGDKTPEVVRERILQLLYTWTKEYPREIKIKEAYEMLKKQRVLKDDLPPTINRQNDVLKPPKSKSTNSATVFDDEEKSKLLQKLLQSKNPDDLQAANRLIKTMVKENEWKVQQNSLRVLELESVHNNVKLLSEMLDSYEHCQSSTEDLELMKELHQACKHLLPKVLRLANETQDNEEMLSDVLTASDELGHVFERYAAVIELGQVSTETDTNSTNNGVSLLDLSSPTSNSPSVDRSISKNQNCNAIQTDMEILGDIFNSLNDVPSLSSGTDTLLSLPTINLVQPMSTQPVTKKDRVDNPVESVKLDGRAKALEDLNELGEALLKQSIVPSTVKTNFTKSSKQTTHVPMNAMMKRPVPLESTTVVTQNSLPDARNGSVAAPEVINDEFSDESSEILNGDIPLVDIKLPSFTKSLNNVNAEAESTKSDESSVSPIPIAPTNHSCESISLTDINVTLENIIPGTVPPLIAFEEKNGISVIFHFAKDEPRPNVSVIVITMTSKNLKPLTNYLFQAVVPQKCKCRLQPPSGTTLPGHNPFLPPSAITQIMLIANPHKESLSLKFMLSYTMNGETITEMGEVDHLPIT